MRSLREVWEGGGAHYGAWLHIPNSFTAELVGRSGYDWVCIDSQHGFAGPESWVSMLQALDLAGVPGVVRVPWNEPSVIMRALDSGAEGVIVPMVNTAEEARAAVAACRYAPAGNRSWGPSRARLRTPDYSPDKGDRLVVCVVMVETRRAVENLDEILAVPGIDGVFVGPNDLAVSANLPPSYDASDPEHRRLIDRIREGCAAHGITAGIQADKPELAARWVAEGFRMLALNAESRLLQMAAEDLVRRTREIVESAPSKS